MKKPVVIILIALFSIPFIAPAQTNQDHVPIDFVKIQAGTFIMGSPVSETSRQRDEVQHQVIVGDFYIAKHEVSQDDYESVLQKNPSRFKGPNLPVENVSWFDAIIYCNARSVREGFTPAYTIRDTEIIWDHESDGYRLPTEIEWEYACRAGTSTAFNTGNNITVNQGNYDGNYPYNRNPKGQYHARTLPVMSFKANAWGLYDMHGNVFEWCWDQYNLNNSSGALDGALYSHAVIRGGSWYSEARFLRSANRASAAHSTITSYIGFRVVRSIL
ncbi:formylglycine-generating enzyme family protein [Treponema primitia]|uniref:formylglycine-generating enzyme family protein n=1 Tax=Treponema primitia TaxID=88058 RepID=UPI0002554FFA|nr:formylglycine-generating enzyme family protein [Treponema primitia]